MAKINCRICPICGNRMTDIPVDWIISTGTRSGHTFATVGTSNNASSALKSAVDFQIAANCAAYDFDYDASVSLGIFGTLFVQCPEVRDSVSSVVFQKNS